MDIAARLIALLLFCVVQSVSAATLYSVSSGSYYTAPGIPPKYSSADAACTAAFATTQFLSQPTEFRLGTTTQTHCNVQRQSGNSWGEFAQWSIGVSFSPCTLPNTWSAESQSCAPVTCPTGVHITDSTATGQRCTGGCLYASYSGGGVNGKSSGFVSTGGTCSEGAETPEMSASQAEAAASAAAAASSANPGGPCPGGSMTCNPVKGRCPKGTFAEDIQGQPLCIALPDSSSSSASSASPVSSSSSSSSTGTSTSTTTSTTVNNGDGSTTTTSTTTTTGTESSTGTETKPNELISFCAQNPSSTICQDAGSWSGSCGAFTCGGDAVQCAQAQQAAKIACALEGEPDSRHEAGEAAMAGGDKPAGHPGADPESIPLALASVIDSSPLFSSSGACPDDVTLTVQGQTVTLPFSDMCPYLNMLGAAFMAACYLMGAFIVFRS